MIDLSDEEKARWNAKIAPAVEAVRASQVGSMTAAEVVAIMQGQ
jgi:hypothetical protein